MNSENDQILLLLESYQKENKLNQVPNIKILGTHGLPEETANLLKGELNETISKDTIPILITNSYNQKYRQYYAFLVINKEKYYLTQVAFGGGFGLAGYNSLIDIINWLKANNINNIYESVLFQSQLDSISQNFSINLCDIILRTARITLPETYLPIKAR